MPRNLNLSNYPIPLQRGVVYGPIDSKRLGRSLGINLLPTTVKICSFDCLYCFYGRTDFKAGLELLPAKERILEEIEAGLQRGLELDYITFSGNGAATLHPDFAEIARGVVKLRNEYYPGLPIAILSNSTELDRREVVEAMNLIDHPIMKLDAGGEATFRKLNRPRRGIKLESVIDSLQGMLGITLQTVFIGGEAANCRGEALDRWIEAVGRINPESAQIYSADVSAPELGLEKVEEDELRRIAERTTQATGTPVKVFV